MYTAEEIEKIFHKTEITNQYDIIGFILKHIAIIEKGISHTELLEKIKVNIVDKFINLRSDFFELVYKKSGSNKFVTGFYFALVYLKPNYYNFIRVEKKAKENYYFITDLGKQFLQDNNGEEFLDLRGASVVAWLQENAPEQWLVSLSNPINKKVKSPNSYILEEIDNHLTIDDSTEENLDWDNEYKEKHYLPFKQELLEQLRNMNPRGLEHLFKDLLSVMGYYNPVVTPSTRDNGIDIVVTEDILGVKKFMVQVKKYQESNKVGRPDIQGFYGALHGAKGIFITTSDFTKDAYEEAMLRKNEVILINGQQLLDYMLDYNIGVNIENTYKFFSVNSHYFQQYQ